MGSKATESNYTSITHDGKKCLLAGKKRNYLYVNLWENKKSVKKYVHRLVMEEKLGRKLESSEIVHHINGDTFDNRPENLEIHSNQKSHMSKHLRRPLGYKRIKKRRKYGKICRNCRSHFIGEIEKIFCDRVCAGQFNTRLVHEKETPEQRKARTENARKVNKNGELGCLARWGRQWRKVTVLN